MLLETAKTVIRFVLLLAHELGKGIFVIAFTLAGFVIMCAWLIAGLAIGAIMNNITEDF